MELFREINSEGRTIIMITHDLNIARYAGRVVHIIDGELTECDSADAGAPVFSGRPEADPGV